MSNGRELSSILEDKVDKERVPLLSANIHINGSIQSTAKLVINHGDNPKEVVEEFCRKYGKIYNLIMFLELNQNIT